MSFEVLHGREGDCKSLSLSAEVPAFDLKLLQKPELWTWVTVLNFAEQVYKKAKVQRS